MLTLYMLATQVLSGQFFNIEALPTPLRIMAYAIPQTYVNQGLRKALMPAEEIIPGFGIPESIIALTAFKMAAPPGGDMAVRAIDGVRAARSASSAGTDPHELSSRSRGVRKRGALVTCNGPSTRSDPIRLEGLPPGAVPQAATSSRNRTAISPSLRCAHPPTTRPAHQMVGPALPFRSNS